jgi:uncharacterized membrane protein YbaN (DUF454 family)
MVEWTLAERPARALAETSRHGSPIVPAATAVKRRCALKKAWNTSMTDTPRSPSNMQTHWPYALLAYLCAALALVGVVVPGLPTTPFLLLAAWAARRGCPPVDRWLRTHRHLGPLLHHWETERAVPRRAKWVAVLMLCAGWVLLAQHADGLLVPVGSAFMFGAVAVFVCSRPAPAAAAKADSSRT